MNETQKNPAGAAFVPVTGRLPAVSSKNRQRLSVFLTKGKTILSQTPVTAAGTFHFYVAPHLASEPGVFVVLGPKGLDAQSVARHTDLPRIALLSARKHERGGISVDFASLNINDELIDPWWIWCPEYTVSGTLETAGGCPIGAQVTVYNVTSGVSGLVETPIVTVPTDANGNFTATFNWCPSPFCWWPCWPLWWHCWPWWWELDILAVIENIESRLTVQSAGTTNVALSNVAPLRQAGAADLMTGVGFAASRAGTVLGPDSARTALIASKFNNPIIRDIFPWWWWCCENPNIVFSATQGPNTILDEDPNISTRWCFASGQTVSLTGNSKSVGACPVSTGGECAFAWSSVGDFPGGVLTECISMGYAYGTGTPPCTGWGASPCDDACCNNLAFAGSLNLNGEFAGGCVAFYQVLAGQWGGNGNPARGGTPPGAPVPVSLTAQLVNYVTIWRAGTATTEVDPVVLGPCSFNGYDNLYVTLSQRQSATTPASVLAQIGNFPTLNPGDFVIGWANPDLVLTVPAGDLIAPAVTNGVTLSIAPFDITGTPIPPADIDMGPDLTLMIDTTPLTPPTIDWVQVYSNGTPPTLATVTMGSTTACPAYQITGSGFALIHTTVVDNAGHLCQYYIQTQYDGGLYATPTPVDRDYAQPTPFPLFSFPTQLNGVDPGYQLPNVNPPPPPAPQVPAATNWTFVGGGDTIYVPITESCCYDFQLWVSKRTTDGQTFWCSAGNPAFQTVNITVTS